VIVITPSFVVMTTATVPVDGTFAPDGGSTGLAGLDPVTYEQFTVPGEAAAMLTFEVVRVVDDVVSVVDAQADRRAAPRMTTRALRITGTACHRRRGRTQSTCRAC
jgi:tetrahydromethanopterin S-methyltransferase subunit C